MGSVDFFGFLPFGFLDLIDILLVAFLLYKLYDLIKGTIAIRIFFGVLSIYLLWLLVTALQMELMSQIFRQFINVGVIALIIVFQQEIRRFLLAIGNSGFFQNVGAKGGLWNWLGKDTQRIPVNVHALTEAVFNLGKTKTGALIVVEREANIQAIIDTGKKVNADVSAMVIENLFFKNSPLHDGALVIRGNKIANASCTLPLTNRGGLPSNYGMRHKAAIGASEESDAVVVVVSEETGEIAICADSVIETYSDKIALRDSLQERLAH
ncbi:MAG TPA: TIGR00159 family protein [Flavobacteriales bacterium]|nr:TIGR00159 family protein [Flavobacteriales bacterium]